MSKPIKTDKNLPTRQIVHLDKEDYITVVGARTATTDISLSGATRFFQSPVGNQYMFINQGLRQLHLFPKTTADHSKQNILVVFQHGYTSNDISRINQYTKNLGARIVYVKTVAQFIEFLNARIEKGRLIKRLVFYSHGVIGSISLHYGGDDEQLGNFNNTSVKQIKKNIFHHDAQVISYACRTGIGVDKDSFKNSAEAKPETSLAQYMANQWKVTVKAFERRSLYAKTYGTASEIKAVDEASKLLKEYETQLDRYNKKITSKKPIMPTNYKLLKTRRESKIIRDDNANNDGGPIMPLGAWHPPTSGETPSGLKYGLQTYQFKAP